MNGLKLEQQEAIASLLHHPGYLCLLDVLQSFETSLLDHLEAEADPEALLRETRYWQFVRRVHGWLRTTPQSINGELDRLRRDGLLDESPRSRNDAWARRFGQDPDNEGDVSI